MHLVASMVFGVAGAIGEIASAIEHRNDKDIFE